MFGIFNRFAIEHQPTYDISHDDPIIDVLYRAFCKRHKNVDHALSGHMIQTDIRLTADIRQFASHVHVVKES